MFHTDLHSLFWGNKKHCYLKMIYLLPTRENSSSKDNQEKTLGIYIFVTLPLPLEIPQICATSLGNSKTKNPRPMENPHDFSLITPVKATSYLIDSGICACFFQYPLKFLVLNSSYLFLSGIGC